jgi:hypothetical protein
MILLTKRQLSIYLQEKNKYETKNPALQLGFLYGVNPFPSLALKVIIKP